MKFFINLLSLFVIFMSLTINTIQPQESKPQESKNEQPQEPKDEYLWLEKVEDERALAWAKEQNNATLAVLQNEASFLDIYKKSFDILDSKERIAYPTIRGKYLYNFWQDENNPRGVWRRTTFEEYWKDTPNWEAVIDIDQLGKRWVFKGCNLLYPDYKLGMVYLSRGGGDAIVIREFDVESKQFVEDGFVLPEAKGSIAWKDKDTVYVQTNFGQGTLTESGYPRITKRWKRGTPLNEAQTVLEGEPTDVSIGSYVINSPERQYEVVYRRMTFYTGKMFVVEDGKLFQLPIPDDAELIGFFKNQLLVELRSDWTIGGETYKSGSLIGIDYNKLLRGDRKFQVILNPDAKSSIVSVTNTKNFLLVNTLDNVRSILYQYFLLDGKWEKRKVPTSDLGTISIVARSEDSDEYFFTYENHLTPTSLYYVSPEQNIKLAKKLPRYFDGERFEVKQNQAISKDGTPILYFSIQPKGMKLDGSNPTVLYGYGGFQIPEIPRYLSVPGATWLEKGGVYVSANIRGGGEFGPQWHQAGLKQNRQKVYDDFIAVAEDLINKKITSPAHLGIIGYSNGGLLVGVAFTQRPELFNAVLCGVPLLDMKRYNKMLAGASWMGEYGNPDIAEEWAYIQKYSPYQNVFPDKKYPRVFFLTSTKDDRVHPGHARKMVAKMKAMGHPIYYYENMEGGHQAAVTNAQRSFQNALIYSYLWTQLK